jgi:hypothetical protein
VNTYHIHIQGGTARVLGIEAPPARVEYDNNVLVLVVPGHSYSAGNRNSLIARSYAPAERQIYRVIERDRERGVAKCERLAAYPVRRT